MGGQQAVYQWQLQVSPELAKRELWSRLGMFGIGGALAAWGVATLAADVPGDARYTIVVGAIFITLGALGLRDSAAARVTTVAIDSNGTMTVTNGKGASAVDLRTATLLAVRRRNARPQWNWSVEVVNTNGAWHATLPAVATYWNLDVVAAEGLERDLRHWALWANGGTALTTSPSTDPAATSTPRTASAVTNSNLAATSMAAPAGTITNTPERFEWRPADHPNKVRNRRRLRIGIGVAAVGIAIFAAVSEWENGAAAVGFSMFVPALILLIGFGADRAYDLSGRFSIVADASGLSFGKTNKTPQNVASPEVADVTVHLRQHHTANAQTSTTTERWWVTVKQRSGDEVEAMLPTYIGVAFDRNDAILLETELRRRTAQ